MIFQFSCKISQCLMQLFRSLVSIRGCALLYDVANLSKDMGTFQRYVGSEQRFVHPKVRFHIPRDWLSIETPLRAQIHPGIRWNFVRSVYLRIAQFFFQTNSCIFFNCIFHISKIRKIETNGGIVRRRHWQIHRSGKQRTDARNNNEHTLRRGQCRSLKSCDNRTMCLVATKTYSIIVADDWSQSGSCLQIYSRKCKVVSWKNIFSMSYKWICPQSRFCYKHLVILLWNSNRRDISKNFFIIFSNLCRIKTNTRGIEQKPSWH